MKKQLISRRDSLKVSLSAAAGLALVRCAPAAPAKTPTQVVVPPAEPITIKISDYQGGSPNYTTAYDQVFELYRKDHPNITLTRRAMGFDEYLSAIKPIIASGELPDLVGLYQGTDLQSAAEAKLIVPLDDAFKADPAWYKRIEKSVKGFDDLQLQDKKTYAFPMDVIVLTMAYHKDMLDKEGLKPWKTIDEFLVIARAMKEKGIYFWSAGAADTTPFKEAFNISVAQQTNGDISLLRETERGEKSWQNDIFFNSIKTIQAILTDIVAPEMLSIDYGVAQQMFYDKKFWAQWYAGEWMAGEYTKNLPDGVKNGNLGLLNFPTATAQANANIWGGGPGQPYAVAVNSKHQDVAIDFAKFLSTPDVCKILVKNDIHPAGELENMSSYSENNILKLFLDTYSKAQVVVPFSTLVPAVIDRFKTNIGQMMLGKMGPEEFLKHMDAQFFKK